MYTLKIVSDREALYQFASYVRVVQGVEDVYVEVGEPLYEHPLMKFYVPVAKTALEAGATRLAVAFLD
ncbi:DUF3928 family protein, partial [Bacillus sp. D-CC]